MNAYVPYKYNPAEMPAEELEKVFVGHGHLLDRLIAAIREQTDALSIQHYLLLGSRGIGKTTLLLMLYRRIKEDPELSSRWFPIRYREEEFYVYTLRDLLALALDHLHEEENISEAGEILAEAEGQADDEASMATITSGLRKISKSYNKKLLLLIDNFGQVFPKGGANDNDQRAFRKLLSTESSFMVIGTSVHLFEDIAAYDEAFFNFFSPVQVENLDDGEIQELLYSRAKLDGNHEFLKDYERQKEKIRAITYLTGGNPRLVLMLYEILSRRQFQPVVLMLRETIDNLTPLLKDVLEDLPRQQSKILDALMRLGGVASPKEIAARSRLSLNTITTQLGRLRQARLIEGKGEGKGRPATYRVCDQMFRTWYQMRYLRPARRRVEMFVEFLSAWFSVEDRITLNRGEANENLGDPEAAIADYSRCAESRTDYKIVHGGLTKLVVLLCKEDMTDDAEHWLARMGDLEPEGTPMEQRLEARVGIVLSLAQQCSLDMVALLLDTALKTTTSELRDKLAFLVPGLAFARSGDESVLTKIPEEEQEMAKRIAARIMESKGTQ